MSRGEKQHYFVFVISLLLLRTSIHNWQQNCSGGLMRHAFLFVVITFSAVAQTRSTANTQTVGSETRTWNGMLVDATRTNCGPAAERAVISGGCPVSIQT